MRINHFSKMRFVDFFKTNVVFIFYYLLFLISFLIGSLAVIFNFSFVNTDIVLNFIDFIINFDIWTVFKQCVTFTGLILTIIYLLSFYSFGSPIIVFVFTAVSYFIGLLFTIICKEFGLAGLLFNSLSLILPVLIVLIILTLISSASISYSTNIVRFIFNNKNVIDIKQKTTDLFVLYLILIFVTSLNSLLFAFLTTFLDKIITN